MKMYLVVKEGVYRHEIVGVYDSVEEATDRAVRVCRSEPDDYHDFNVMEFEVDEDVHDGKLLVTIKRKNDTVNVEIVDSKESNTG